MGWPIILALALAVFAGLWLLGGIRGPALQLLGASLCIALAGYAWQGRPTLAGKPAQPAIVQAREEVAALTDLRHAILGRFDRADTWLTIADSFLRRGDSRTAVAVVRSGIRAHPQDPDLWVGLGNALVIHAGGYPTPAAEMAFVRAEQLAPKYPGALFFHGLALAAGGRFDEAEAKWRTALALAPPNLSWRPQVERRLLLMQQLREMAQGAEPPP